MAFALQTSLRAINRIFGFAEIGRPEGATLQKEMPSAYFGLAENTSARCEIPKRKEKHCDFIAIMPLARNLEFAPVNKFTCDFSLFFRFSFLFLVFRSLIRIFNQWF